MNILITGGTGSFGTAFLEHLNAIHYAGTVRVFSRDEAKQINLESRYPNLQLETFIGDIRDIDSYTAAARKMDIVVHAAAIKHVPVGELFTEECIKTNTLGAINMVKACQANGVQKAVYLSTDKAVYPINAYGMSKALGEKVMTSKASRECETTFCITRYGNVIGSRGSILPVLKSRLHRREPILITDFSMTRFLMSMQEAVSLVNHAIAHGTDGQLFIQKVDASDLRTLIEAYLREYHQTSLEEYGYQHIGVRPGEKQHEVLATQEELTRAIFLADHNLICVAPYPQQELYQGSYAHPVPWSSEHDFASNNAPQLSLEAVQTILRQCLTD
jgi:UDP-N-acetylglucosamine 4,6-dehydratase